VTSVAPQLGAKLDPYNTPMHRRIDAFLILVIVLTLFFIFRTSAQHRQSQSLVPSEPAKADVVKR
jgi:hypothetical protein